MVTIRLLLAMMLGAFIALLGGLFLGEYEFDEWLPIVSGALLGLIVAEIVVSVGKHRSLALGLVIASWSVAAVVLAGIRDASADEPVKSGVYVSAGLAALAALARASNWRLRRGREGGSEPTSRADPELPSSAVPEDGSLEPAPSTGDHVEWDRGPSLSGSPGGAGQSWSPEETSPWAEHPDDREPYAAPAPEQQDAPTPIVRLRARSAARRRR